MTLQGFWQTGSKGQLCNVAQLSKPAGFASNMKLAAWQGWVLPQVQGSQAGCNLQQESRPAEFTGSSRKPAAVRGTTLQCCRVQCRARVYCHKVNTVPNEHMTA